MTFSGFARRVLASAALASLAAGCTRVESGSHGNPTTRAHELRFSDGEDIGGLNPMFFQQIDTAYVGELTSAWLFRYDHANRPVPELATEVPTKRNGDIDAAGTRITVKLRRGVVWSDGVPFTADDVIFTTNEMNDPRNPVTSRDGFDDVVKMDEPNKYTVVFHLKRPYGGFVLNFYSTGAAQPAILPKHLFPHPGDLSHAAYNALPIGIGPFKYEAWHRGVNVTMVPNPRYWRGVPKLKRVTFAIISNANTLLTQTQTGNLDLYLRTPPNFIGELRALHGYRVVSNPSYLYQHYDFNLQQPAVADVVVRRALRLALDRSEIVKKVRLDEATLSDSVTPATYPDVPHHVPLVAYDPAAANAMLDAAGWKRGFDGVRAKNGVRLALTLAFVSGNPQLDQIAELTRAWWKQIGVAMSVKTYLASEFFDPLAGVLRKGHFDVAFFGWQAQAIDDPTNIFACKSFPPDGQNYGRWCDPKLTPILHEFQNTYDSVEQGRALGRSDLLIASQAPTIVLYESKNLNTANTDLTGWHPNQVSAFDDMMNVDI